MLAEKVKNKEFLEKTIKNLKKENPAADIQLLEKMVGALYLVESLVNQGLNFIFKGGTSLVLLLNELKRFSIDVDILTEERRGRVVEVVKNIVESQDFFTRYEENIRSNSASQRMDLQHFKFFFDSVTDMSEKYILLDVAYESNKYPKLVKRKIQSTNLGIESGVSVTVPSVESILGDKLTVIAPKTTGISYNSNKELELMKQLYDVDKLFNQSEDIAVVRKSFVNIAIRELKYRKLKDFTYVDVLDDIEEFAENIIFLKDKTSLAKINIGMSKLAGFRLEKKFLIDKEVLTAASKALYLVRLIRSDKTFMEKFSLGTTLDEIDPTDPDRKRLKVIRKMNAEAFFYVMKAKELKEFNERYSK